MVGFLGLLVAAGLVLGAPIIVCLVATWVAWKRLARWRPRSPFPDDVPALIAAAFAAVWAYHRAVAVIGRIDWFGYMPARFQAIPTMVIVAIPVLACTWGLSTLISTALQSRTRAVNWPVVTIAATLVATGCVLGHDARAFAKIYTPAERYEKDFTGWMIAQPMDARADQYNTNDTVMARTLADIINRYEQRRSAYARIETVARALHLIGRHGVPWYVARNGKASPEVLSHLAADPDSEVRAAAKQTNAMRAEALAEQAPPEQAQAPAQQTRSLTNQTQTLAPPLGFHHLHQPGDSEVALLKGPLPDSTRQALVTVLASASDPFKRSRAATFADPTLLAVLSTDSSAQVRSSVASVTWMPTDAVRRLAHDTVAYIRAGVAFNRCAPTDVLVMLAHDSVTDVRWGIASNQSTPDDVVASLAKDREPKVSQEAAQTITGRAYVRQAKRPLPELSCVWTRERALPATALYPTAP